MSGKEKSAYLITPTLIGFILIFTGVFVSLKKPEVLQGIVMISTGLISVVLAVMMSLLIRLLSKN
ncbi:hypothetical protein HY604_03440 [Candidatus Peregrinibacteria bacterium]|nr:hypothetical protein [Candidatus Peregrinibacteria bacterium]